ncbi:Alpha/beta hydrolase fold-1 [Xylariales sp. PMI_506]|nr:Alpha/beta hydrolase fold-1 [Xylariales sp. PMI_506]
MGSLQPSKAILIIHGAWHVPEHYAKLTSGLEAAGFRVLCPRLPTSNNASPPDKSLEDDVVFIRELVSAEVRKGTHLTVLAHSAGGVVATAALGDFALGRVRESGSGAGGVAGIIFVAAFVPSEGQSIATLFGATKPPGLAPQDDGTVIMENPIHQFYNDLPEEEAQRMEELLVPAVMKSVLTPIDCSIAAWRVIPVAYVYTAKDNAVPLFAQEMLVGKMEENGVKVNTVQTSGSHSVYISQTDRIVKCVVDLVNA